MELRQLMQRGFHSACVENTLPICLGFFVCKSGDLSFCLFSRFFPGWVIKGALFMVMEAAGDARV